MLLALLSNPRLATVQIHQRSLDDRFDLSDLVSPAERAAMRRRSAAVTERLTVSSGTADRTEM
jgi:hypothetical protein